MIKLFAGLVLACLVTLGTGPAYAMCGNASWYGPESGGTMANGRRFNPNAFTAAMWDVPFGTRVRVTTGRRSVVVVITDRGPARRLHRVIDLSRAAARALGMGGLARVCVVETG